MRDDGAEHAENAMRWTLTLLSASVSASMSQPEPDQVVMAALSRAVSAASASGRLWHCTHGKLDSDDFRFHLNVRAHV